MTYKQIIQKYGQWIREACIRHGHDDSLIAALIMTESSGEEGTYGDANRNGVRDAGDAFGITMLRQVAIDDYNREIGTRFTTKDVERDPRLAIEITAWYLRTKIREAASLCASRPQFRIRYGLQAYNAGFGNFRNDMRQGLDYACKVFMYQVEFAKLYCANKSV